MNWVASGRLIYSRPGRLRVASYEIFSPERYDCVRRQVADSRPSKSPTTLVDFTLVDFIQVSTIVLAHFIRYSVSFRSPSHRVSDYMAMISTRNLAAAIKNSLIIKEIKPEGFSFYYFLLLFFEFFLLYANTQLIPIPLIPKTSTCLSHKD